MEPNENVAVPDVEKNMSQSENAPVSYYGDNGLGGTSAALLAGIATRNNEYNPVDAVAAGGICDLRAEVSNNRWFVKDAEAQIRRDIAKAEADIRAEVLKEGQDNLKATMAAECNLSKEILETRHTLAKDILRSEYENKLAIQAAIKEINANAQHNAERTQDFVNHGFEEVNEKLCECCSEAALAAQSQTGLLTILVNALNVGAR